MSHLKPLTVAILHSSYANPTKGSQWRSSLLFLPTRGFHWAQWYFVHGTAVVDVVPFWALFHLYFLQNGPYIPVVWFWF